MSLAAIRLIAFILGMFLITLAASMAIPLITLVCGLLLIAHGRPDASLGLTDQ
ncbi:hypothetical protein [Pseudomonas chlororaphis]|uniref:hypothetical protein n=1 Tax=Pseudomonas chlororaphis TaxID=587753 RepID=UPI002366481E|nr:hypothetical protein [Pseudomonas chlororaphis]WDH26065.1 hypothetical protein PUP50_29810 [Pseudomonas chlororaphis]